VTSFTLHRLGWRHDRRFEPLIPPPGGG